MAKIIKANFGELHWRKEATGEKIVRRTLETCIGEKKQSTKNYKANFGDLHEKKTVFIEFLEIIQSKHRGTCTSQNRISSKLLRIEFPEVICIPGMVYWIAVHIF